MHMISTLWKLQVEDKQFLLTGGAIEGDPGQRKRGERRRGRVGEREGRRETTILYIPPFCLTKDTKIYCLNFPL